MRGSRFGCASREACAMHDVGSRSKMQRIAFALVFVLAMPTAHAGRTFYGWLYGTEVVAERNVELESWIDERDVQFASLGDRQTTWTIAPVIGITDRLELALPLDSIWYGEDNPTPGFVAGSVVPQRYGAELRYRFVARDAVDAPPFAPLVRVAIKRDVTGAVRPEADLVLSFQRGRFHALADAGLIADFSTSPAYSRANGDRHAEFHPGLGVSVRTVGDLRFGAELHVELALDASETGHTWGIAGPNVSWTHGRFWVSGVYGVGVYGIRSAPRVVWGFAL
jgi:hypothetical protein